MTAAQRRRHPRVKVEMHVDWGVRGAGRLYQDRVTSLSVGGCFIRTDRDARGGQPVFVRLWLSPGGESELTGRIAYSLERVGVGVQFEGLEEGDRINIQDIVEFYSEGDGLAAKN